MSTKLSYTVEEAQFDFDTPEAAEAFMKDPNVEFVLDLYNADQFETIFPFPHPDSNPEAPSEIVRINLTPTQYTLTREDETTVSVNASVEFDTELLPNTSTETFNTWVEKEGGWATANINLGENAEPLGDDSITLKIV